MASGEFMWVVFGARRAELRPRRARSPFQRTVPDGQKSSSFDFAKKSGLDRGGGLGAHVCGSRPTNAGVKCAFLGIFARSG